MGGGVSRRSIDHGQIFVPPFNLPRLPGNLKAIDIPYSIISWTTLPFYAHDGQGHHGADHGDVLDVSHEGAQEGAESPCVGEESCQLRERKNGHRYKYIMMLILAYQCLILHANIYCGFLHY